MSVFKQPLFTKSLNYGVLPLITMILLACGGGSGGSGGGGNPFKETPFIRINSETAQPVAGDLLKVTELLFQLTGPDFIRTASLATTTGHLLPCVSGSVTVTLTDIDSSGDISTSDKISLLYENCRDSGIGVTLNGDILVVVVSWAGNPNIPASMWDATVTVVYKGMFVTNVSGNRSVKGFYELNVSTTDGVTFDEFVSVSSFATALAPEVWEIDISEFSSQLDGAMDAYSRIAQGQVTMSSFEAAGRALYDTAPAFEGVGADYPSTGAMKISGKDRSSVTIIPLDAINVRLDIDENADGAVDDTIDTTWAALLS